MQNRTKYNIALFCGSLSYAGAQRQMLELAKGLNNTHNIIVCSIKEDAGFSQEFKKNNIRVIELKLKAKNIWGVITRLHRIVNEYNIDLLYSFLDVANYYSILLKVLLPKTKVVLSERSSHSYSRIKPLVYWLFKKTPDAYIANSYAGKQYLASQYNIQNAFVVHNGVDLNRFNKKSKPHIMLPEQYRNYIKITMVARIKYQKQYEFFLELAEKTCSMYANVVFIAVGDEPSTGDQYNNEIKKRHNSMEHKEKVIFIGAQNDIPSILNNSDISILTSLFEGCSNTVLESMFAGCPLLITNVGDNKLVVSKINQDFVVDVESRDEMLSKLSILVESPEIRQKIGQANYIHAIENFAVDSMVKKTIAVFDEIFHSNATKK